MTKTKLSRANDKSPSLRTTVPQLVVESLDLKVGESVDWVLKPENGEMVAVVRKA